MKLSNRKRQVAPDCWYNMRSKRPFINNLDRDNSKMSVVKNLTASLMLMRAKGIVASILHASVMLKANIIPMRLLALSVS